MKIKDCPFAFPLLVLLPASGAAQDSSPLQWQPLQSEVEASLRGISAVSDRIAWAGGSQGTVLLTTDGGEKWVRKVVPQASDLDFRDIHALDERTAYLLSAGSGELSRIYKTSDGGESWRLLYTNPHPEGFFNGLDFWDAEHGIVVGDPVEGRLFVLTTSDGGKSWQRVPAESLPPVVQGEYGFAASGTNLATVGDSLAWIGTGGAAARVFRSEDRGKTWSVADTPIVCGKASAGIFSLRFSDARNGMAVGGDYQQPDQAGGNLARSSDGGRSWTLVEAAPPLPYRSIIVDVRLGGQKLWAAAGPSGTDFSLDGGQTWHRAGPDGYHTLGVSGGTIWAAGAEGRVARAIVTH